MEVENFRRFPTSHQSSCHVYFGYQPRSPRKRGTTPCLHGNKNAVTSSLHLTQGVSIPARALSPRRQQIGGNSSSAPPEDVVWASSSQSGTIPAQSRSKVMENVTPFYLILFLKVQQTGAFLSMLAITCIMCAFPCPQWKFPVALFRHQKLPLFSQCYTSFFFLFKRMGSGEGRRCTTALP